MTAITAYNRQAIMQEAWDRTRDFLARNPHGRMSVFASYLREAWTNEKARLRNVRRAAILAALTVEQLRNQIERAEYGEPRADDFPLVQLHTALTAKEAEETNAAKRDLIRNAPACVVTFIKANGTRRVMRVEARKVADNVKGDAGNRTGRIASHTRAYRHPHLLPVWDSEAGAIKSVNLSTVTAIETVQGTHQF